MATDLEGAMGHDYASSEVQKIVDTFSLNEIYDDPPFRQYVGSKENGIDLLFENKKLISIQIFMSASQGFQPFSGEAPLKIKRMMSRDQVHQLLGEPKIKARLVSKYEFSHLRLKVSINFNDASQIAYINIGLLRPAAH